MRVVNRINEHPDRLSGLTSEYRIELTGEGGGAFRLRMQDGQVVIGEDRPEPARASVTLSTGDFQDLLDEKVSAMGLFMQGRVKLAGDMSDAFRLEALLRG